MSPGREVNVAWHAPSAGRQAGARRRSRRRCRGSPPGTRGSMASGPATSTIRPRWIRGRKGRPVAGPSRKAWAPQRCPSATSSKKRAAARHQGRVDHMPLDRGDLHVAALRPGDDEAGPRAHRRQFRRRGSGFITGTPGVVLNTISRDRTHEDAAARCPSARAWAGRQSRRQTRPGAAPLQPQQRGQARPWARAEQVGEAAEAAACRPRADVGVRLPPGSHRRRWPPAAWRSRPR